MPTNRDEKGRITPAQSKIAKSMRPAVQNRKQLVAAGAKAAAKARPK